RRTALLVAVLRRNRRARHGSDSDRPWRIGLQLRHIDYSAAEVRLPVSIEEVEDEASQGPKEEQLLRFLAKAEEQQETADDRKRSHKEHHGGAEGPHPVGVGVAQDH